MTLSLLAGCKGKDGSDGVAGPNGTNGTNGLPSTAVYFPDLSDSEVTALKMSGKITGVSISSAPVVTFQITDAAGTGISGLGVKNSSNNNKYFRFGLAKLVSGSSVNANYWESYGITGTSKTPTMEKNGTIVDHGDGSYTYTFSNNITANTNTWAPAYDATKTHRLAILVYNQDDSTNPANFTPVNITYDFVPNGSAVTETRDIVSKEACLSCHTKFTFHDGSRFDPKTCAMCHTYQRANGAVASTPTSTGLLTGTSQSIVNGFSQTELVTFIHKIHMGDELTLQGYT